MNPLVKSNLANYSQDPRLYLALGLANWSVFVDHIPGNAVGLLTMRNFGFSGAASLFVFVAGYGFAIIYGRVMLERGFVVAATRAFRTVWRLYAAYVVLFVLYIDAIAYVAGQSSAPEILKEYNVTGILDHPLRILVRGLLLQSSPLNMEILQLFIPLAAFFPFALWGLSRRPNIALAASIALYLAAGIFDWTAASFPDGEWRFNPYRWQLLFVLGAWFAVSGAPGPSIHRQRWLRMAALAYVLLAMVIVLAQRSPELSSHLPVFLQGPFDAADRENLALYRILHLLALAFLFVHLVPKDQPWLRSWLIRPIIRCGEEWLAVFCAGVFLSFAGHLILITGPDLLVMQILVSLAGLAVMTTVAYYVSWSKRQDHPWAARKHT